MRDADRIREQPASAQPWGTVIMTLAAVVGVCGVFAMGYTIGRRVQRLEPCAVPPPEKTRQVTELLDFERLSHNELTFYDTLMADSAKLATDPGHASQAPARKSTVVAAAARSQLPPPDPATFTLQVSSVRRRDEAQALATAMTRQGLRPYITAATLKDRGTWYRVRVGRYENVRQANVARAHLADADIPARVMRAD